MTVAEKIKNMDNEELASFVWWFAIHQITCFVTDEQKNRMNFIDIKNYLEKDESEWIEFKPNEEDEDLDNENIN